jgi:hypothetical protein
VQPRQRAHVALQPAHAAVLLPLRAPPQQGQVAERRLARRQPPEAPPPPHRAPGKLTRCRGHRGGAPGRRAAAERVALLGACAPLRAGWLLRSSLLIGPQKQRLVDMIVVWVCTLHTYLIYRLLIVDSYCVSVLVCECCVMSWR